MPEKDPVVEFVSQILQEVGPISDCAGSNNKNVLELLRCRRKNLAQRPSIPDWLTVVEKLAEKAVAEAMAEERLQEKIKEALQKLQENRKNAIVDAQKRYDMAIAVLKNILCN